MRFHHRFRMTAPLILPLAIAACAKPDARANAADPNTPAVVKAPPVVLPSDTASKVVPPVISTDDARFKVSQNYALLGAGFTFIDPRLITAAYAPDAVLTTPNGTFTGPDAILNEYKSFGMDGSLKEFSRQSAVLKVIDSTVVDSGRFTVVRARSKTDSTVEHGSYSSVWRIQAPPAQWVMTRDHLYQLPKQKR